MSRYLVQESTEHDCCFDSSIVDTANPVLNANGQVCWFETVCECRNRETAELIARLLNSIGVDLSKS